MCGILKAILMLLLKLAFSISSHVSFVAGHILELVEYYAARIRPFLCNQSPIEENQI